MAVPTALFQGLVLYVVDVNEEVPPAAASDLRTLLEIKNNRCIGKKFSRRVDCFVTEWNTCNRVKISSSKFCLKPKPYVGLAFKQLLFGYDQTYTNSGDFFGKQDLHHNRAVNLNTEKNSKGYFGRISSILLDSRKCTHPQKSSLQEMAGQNLITAKKILWHNNCFSCKIDDCFGAKKSAKSYFA